MISAYNSLSISQYAWATSVAPTPLSITADADTFDGYSTQTPVAGNKWCPPLAENIIRLPSQNITQLQGYVNGLTAIGATSINAGLKWGLGLLDPGSRPIYNTLIGGGAMPAALAGRPFAYDDVEAMKVIVLMTDGEHWAEERAQDSKKFGFSPVFLNVPDGRYSIFHDSKVNSSSPTNICNSRPYWVPHLSTWHSRPWNGTAPSGSACYVVGAATTATQQLWTQVWSAKNMQWAVCNWFAIPLGTSCSSTAYADLLATFRTQTATTAMDTQLQSICTLAKAQNVIIYGIAFEASTNGQTQIRNCSTDGDTGSHYFNATGLQISTAFSAIANNISQLRLTQ